MAPEVQRGKKIDELWAMLVEHAALAAGAVEALEELLSRATSGDVAGVERAYARVNELEHRADDLKREVARELRLTYLHPFDAQELLRMLTTVDDVAGFSKAASKRLVAMTHGGLSLSGPYGEALAEMVRRSVEASRLLRDVIKVFRTNTPEALKMAQQIEAKEKEVDEIRLRTLELLYRECAASLKPMCVLLPGLIDDVEAITDACEDAVGVLKLFSIAKP